MKKSLLFTLMVTSIIIQTSQAPKDNELQKNSGQQNSQSETNGPQIKRSSRGGLKTFLHFEQPCSVQLRHPDEDLERLMRLLLEFLDKKQDKKDQS